MRSGAWKASALHAAIVSILLVGALSVWSLLEHGAVALRGTPLASSSAPAFVGLTDTEGEAFSWRNERGNAVLVFFGYTHCPDVCPLTLAALMQTFRILGPLRQHVQLVFVSLDPARDTRHVLRTYLSAFDPKAIGLTGPLREVAISARQWGVTWHRVDVAGGDYWIDHSAAVTLVGPDGRLLARYGYGQLTNPAWLAGDLRATLEAR